MGTAKHKHTQDKKKRLPEQLNAGLQLRIVLWIKTNFTEAEWLYLQDFQYFVNRQS